MDTDSEKSSRDFVLKLLILYSKYSKMMTEQLKSFIFERKEIDTASILESSGNLLHILNEIVDLWGDCSNNIPFLIN